LVKSELPVYPHTKTVWSEEEGAELATYLGDGKAVLMRGHGATMTGKTVEDSVLSMLQLEEQARMNYWALVAKGSDHKYLSDVLVDESTNRPQQSEYPHFKELMRRIGGNPPRDGTWNSYKKKVSGDMIAP
jgi:ribulose-5-phosphate 4-epimerase/fuculose-1-phosphate aldolase